MFRWSIFVLQSWVASVAVGLTFASCALLSLTQAVEPEVAGMPWLPQLLLCCLWFAASMSMVHLGRQFRSLAAHRWAAPLGFVFPAVLCVVAAGGASSEASLSALVTTAPVLAVFMVLSTAYGIGRSIRRD